MICRACGLSDQTKEGTKYLDQLRFLVESSIKAAVEEKKEMTESRGSTAGPSLRCSDEVLCEIVRETGELCSMFGEHQLSDVYYDK